MKATAIDIFSGAGGLSTGIQNAGFKILLANEIETNFANTYRHNHPNTKMLNCDIHDVNFYDELKCFELERPVDLVCGGPPCQGFSTVGSKSEIDKRNTLFYEFLRAVSEISPNYILFENVSGFKKMYEGKAYITLLKELDIHGYNCNHGILEASTYGLPQKRERTIIIGWKKHLPSISFPQPTHGSNKALPLLTLIEAISDLPPLKDNDSADYYLLPPQNDFQKRMRENSNMVSEHNSSVYGDKMKKILSLIPEGGCVLDLPVGLRPKKSFNNTYARLNPNKVSPTITRNFGTPSSSRCVHPFQNRALSTREGARLQGFPDSYQFIGGKTSKNLQIGNAVPPIFGEVIAKEILKTMFENKIIG